MPRYFFDIHIDGHPQIDQEGHVFATEEQVRREAQRIIPEIAYHEVPDDGNRKNYVVLVRDEQGQPIFSACLAYHGTWLKVANQSE